MSATIVSHLRISHHRDRVWKKHTALDSMVTKKKSNLSSPTDKIVVCKKQSTEILTISSKIVVVHSLKPVITPQQLNGHRRRSDSLCCACEPSVTEKNISSITIAQWMEFQRSVFCVDCFVYTGAGERQPSSREWSSQALDNGVKWIFITSFDSA